jgi:hypothetical protein
MPELDQPLLLWIQQQSGTERHERFGGIEKKRYLLETTGAVLPSSTDRDGLVDLFSLMVAALTTLRRYPTNHLYRNNGAETFTDASRRRLD